MKNIGQEPCDDAISRQAVMEICNEEWDSDLIVERIGQLPSITPQQKTGRWIDRNCSRCGCRSMLGLCIENYCANCGAKMQEVEK